ncbi:MAG: O-antigen ligase family protein [Deltaproteobacteria bacterium]|nr:O-antigen ligase family protein [Deltaproteobacteria bacterium]
MKTISSSLRKLRGFSPSFVLLLIWWQALYWTYSTAWPRPFDDWKNTLFYVGSGLFALWFLWRDRASLQFRLNAPFLFFIGYLLACLISLNKPVYEEWLAIARLILWGGTVWLLTRTSNAEWKFLIKMAVLSAALIALLNWLSLHGIDPWPHFPREIYPPIGHMTYYGDFIGLHLPFALYLIWVSGKWRERLLWLSALALLVAGLWISGTRASLVGIFSAFVLGGILSVTSGIISWKRLSLIGMVLMALFGVVHQLQPQGRRDQPTFERLRLIFQGGKDPNISDRLLEYGATLKMIEQKPLKGWGIGSFRFVYPEFGQPSIFSWFYHPHNEVLHQASEVGFVGLFFFLFFWGWFFVWGAKKVAHPIDRSNKIELIVPLMGITVGLMSWQFSTTFLSPLIRSLTALYLAIFLKGILPVDKVKSHKAFGFFFGVVLFLATLFLAAYQASLYAVAKSYYQQDAVQGKRWVDLAYRLAPGAFDPLLRIVETETGQEDYLYAEQKIRLLYQEYPHVSWALFYQAMLERERNHTESAIGLLQHALENAAFFERARSELELLKKRRHH